MNTTTSTTHQASVTETPVPGMDPTAVERWAQRKGSSSAWLHEEVGIRMAQRLLWIKAKPSCWLSWEPVHAGVQAHRTVASTYPTSRAMVQARQPANALAALKASAPEASGLMGRWRYSPPDVAQGAVSVDMLWANMLLHATHAPQTLLRQWHAALRTDGFLMFSCLGPDSLAELRQVYRQLGWLAPAHAFTDMHDWGDMLVQAGFAEPVMDMERITLTYSNVPALLADLRALGRNLSTERATTTRGRLWLADWQAQLETHMPRLPDGRLFLSFEVIYGHAHKGMPRVPLAAASAVSLQNMREMLGAGVRRAG